MSLPISHNLNRNNAFRVLTFAIFILAFTARLVPGTRTIDDSYITYRYARNILAGNGFVYNPGERVLGTTTPLYAFLLSTIGLFTGGEKAPFPQISLIINAFADAITCLLILHLGRNLGSMVAGVGAALIWAIAPFSVTFAIGGLETSLYVLLLTATIWAYIEPRFVLAAFLGSLALLTRPDALILLAPLALDRFIEYTGIGVRLGFKTRSSVNANRRNIWKEILALGLPRLAWLLFSSLYFGNPLPHSIAAKSVAYHLNQNEAFIRLLQHYSVPFMGNLTFGNWWIAVGMVVNLFLFIIGARNGIKHEPHSWPLFAYPWLYFGIYALANPLIFRWYLTPPLPAYILGILIGIECLLKTILVRRRTLSEDNQPSSISWQLTILPIIFVILLPLFLISRDWKLHPDHGANRPAPEMAWYKLELLYKQAADTLSPEIAQQTSSLVLAAGDVGVLGYFTSTRILDTVGLNSPESTKYYPLDDQYYTINYAIPPKLIMDQLPEYIVILEVYGRNGLLKDADFKQTYTLLEKIPTDIYGSDGMLIFKRNF